MDSADAVPRGYRIGYGRVSTRDQNPDSQRDALKTAGCDEIFIDKGAERQARRACSSSTGPSPGCGPATRS